MYVTNKIWFDLKYPDKNNYPKNPIGYAWLLQRSWNIVSTINWVTPGTRFSKLEHCITFSGPSVSHTSELGTDIAVGYSCKGWEVIWLFYDVSTGSEQYIFPFHAKLLLKGRELEILFKYIEELLSFSVDVKTDFVYFLFEVGKKYFQNLHSSLVVVS